MDVVLAKFIWRRLLQKWPNYKLVSGRYLTFFYQKMYQNSHLLFAPCYSSFSIEICKKRKSYPAWEIFRDCENGPVLREAPRLESRSIIDVRLQCYFFAISSFNLL